MNTNKNVIPVNTLCKVKINKAVAETYGCPSFFIKNRVGYTDNPAEFMMYYNKLTDKFRETYTAGDFSVYDTDITYAKYPNNSYYVGYSDGTYFHILKRIYTYTNLDKLISETPITEIKNNEQLNEVVTNFCPEKAVKPMEYIDVCGNELSNIEYAQYIANRAIRFYENIINYVNTNNIPYLDYTEYYDASNVINTINNTHLLNAQTHCIIVDMAQVKLSDIKLSDTIGPRSNFITDFYGDAFVNFINTKTNI